MFSVKVNCVILVGEMRSSRKSNIAGQVVVIGFLLICLFLSSGNNPIPTGKSALKRQPEAENYSVHLVNNQKVVDELPIGMPTILSDRTNNLVAAGDQLQTYPGQPSEVDHAFFSPIQPNAP